MLKTPLTIIMVAAAALAGCNQSDHTINAGEPYDPQANAANAANAVAPGDMPPAIVASKTYRCKDNSLVYIDWLAGDVSADLRTEKGGTPVVLKAAKAGDALKADGYSLIGLPTATTVTLTRPTGGQQSCKA